MHPVYTSHRNEVQAVYSHVARIYIRNTLRKTLSPDQAEFIGRLFTAIGRIHLMFEEADTDIIRVSSEDLETIKRICRYCGEHPELLKGTEKEAMQ